VRAGGKYHCWEALDESYKFASNFNPIGGMSKKLCPHKVAGVKTGIVSRLLLGSLETKKPFGCKSCGEAQKILYGGR
jgi:hypothetical protein